MGEIDGNADGMAHAGCWPWSHRWMKWRDLQARELLREDRAGTIGMAIKQERRCSSCNMVQLRTEQTTL